PAGSRRAARTRAPWRDWAALTKPGITRHVLVTAAAGYYLGAAGRPDWPRVAAFLAGTALVSGGTNALNQWWEREVDGRMPRTRSRPIPAGRVAPPAALAFGLAIGVAGVALLAWRANLLTAALATFTLASYVLVYTPLKRRTTLNTLVGCVPGALPILGGWTAATGRAAPAGWALFAVLFLWQLPHTLSLVWLHRRDYRAGGLVMPGADDDAGRRTALKSAAWALALVAASLVVVPLGVAGRAYFAVALALGAWLVVDGALWAARPTPARARRLFLATLGYLPLLLGTMAAAHAAGI
ncbi:MAG TPA: heme o synthase, partial [Gemmatimonadales bacterium]|nr:heme o synthase [Gemmatimonadales bacterium]